MILKVKIAIYTLILKLLDGHNLWPFNDIFVVGINAFLKRLAFTVDNILTDPVLHNFCTLKLVVFKYIYG